MLDLRMPLLSGREVLNEVVRLKLAHRRAGRRRGVNVPEKGDTRPTRSGD